MIIESIVLAGVYFGNRYYKKSKKNLKPKENVDKKKSYHKRDLQISIASLGLSTISSLSLVVYGASIAVFTYSILPVFERVKKSIKREKKPTHDLLVLILSILAIFSRQIFAMSIGMFIYYLGRNAIEKSKEESKKMIEGLFNKKSKKAWILKGDVELEVDINDINRDDIVVVRNGDLIPIDGIIVDGMASVNQANLTGESIPSEKEKGDRVFASSTIVSGKLLIKTEKKGDEVAIHKIEEILKNTTNSQTKTQYKSEELANNVATPLMLMSIASFPIIGIFGATAILNASFGNRVQLLAPLGVLNHLSIAYKKGILIKDGRSLELLNSIDSVLFDKTGTLTTDEPTIGEFILFDDKFDKNLLFSYLASSESKIKHPIAKAITKKANELNLNLPKIDSFEYKLGLGIVANIDGYEIKVGSSKFFKNENLTIPDKFNELIDKYYFNGSSIIFLAINNKIEALLEIKPSVRVEVKTVIDELRKRGIKHIGIVSGDSKEPTKNLAQTLGMDCYYYDIDPTKKGEIVEELQKSGKKVCFIGDGVNDSIAIKKADVSISLKGATTVATDLSQIILMNGSLEELPLIFDISKSLEKSNKNVFKVAMIPFTINLTGAFILNFNLLITIICNNASLFWGYRNIRKDYLKDKNIDKTESQKRLIYEK